MDCLGVWRQAVLDYKGLGELLGSGLQREIVGAPVHFSPFQSSCRRKRPEVMSCIDVHRRPHGVLVLTRPMTLHDLRLAPNSSRGRMWVNRGDGPFPVTGGL